jgi:hypothetical protein
MLYMVIETFRGGDPRPVYRRFWDRGRLMPEGMEYRGSWVTEDLRGCFQVVECQDPSKVAMTQQTGHIAPCSQKGSPDV